MQNAKLEVRELNFSFGIEHFAFCIAVIGISVSSVQSVVNYDSSLA